jgi:hypothetical protein
MGRSGPKHGQKPKWVALLGGGICPREHVQTGLVRLGWAIGDALMIAIEIEGTLLKLMQYNLIIMYFHF